MKVLVTGGAGFIGSVLADSLLKDGIDVVILDNFSDDYPVVMKERNVAPNLSNPKYTLYRGDVRDAKLLEKIFSEHAFDQVVHLAGCASVRDSINDPMLFADKNILGLIDIVEAMRRHQVKKIVFSSSSSVYGRAKAGEFKEDARTSEPLSPYAATKLACEQMLHAYCHLLDIEAVCLRFFTVYGPRQRPTLAIRKFAELIKAGKPIPVYGDGTSVRDYTYIDDLVRGMRASMDYHGAKYEIFNLGGGHPVSLSEMIETIEKALGKKAIINREPKHPADVDKTVSDITKAGNMLDYHPRVSFDEGIRMLIDWLDTEEGRF